MSDFELQPGDCLLYKGKGLYGFIIRLKTWHNVGHVEVYLGKDAKGNDISTASRDHIGVGIYPTRRTELIAVGRPKAKFDAVKAKRFAKAQTGTPYGWTDLLNFAGLNIDTKGIVCSPYATLVYRAVGLDPFNKVEPVNKIAPMQFLTSALFDWTLLEDEEK